MSDESAAEVYHCAKCGEKEPAKEMLIPVEIPLTGEEWNLCELCTADMVDWIEGEDRERYQ